MTVMDLQPYGPFQPFKDTFGTVSMTVRVVSLFWTILPYLKLVRYNSINRHWTETSVSDDVRLLAPAWNNKLSNDNSINQSFITGTHISAFLGI